MSVRNSLSVLALLVPALVLGRIGAGEAAAQMPPDQTELADKKAEAKAADDKKKKAAEKKAAEKKDPMPKAEPTKPQVPKTVVTGTYLVDTTVPTYGVINQVPYQTPSRVRALGLEIAAFTGAIEAKVMSGQGVLRAGDKPDKNVDKDGKTLPSDDQQLQNYLTRLTEVDTTIRYRTADEQGQIDASFSNLLRTVDLLKMRGEVRTVTAKKAEEAAATAEKNKKELADKKSAAAGAKAQADADKAKAKSDAKTKKEATSAAVAPVAAPVVNEPAPVVAPAAPAAPEPVPEPARAAPVPAAVESAPAAIEAAPTASDPMIEQPTTVETQVVEPAPAK